MNYKNARRTYLSPVLGVALLASLEQAGASVLEEVIVTATKREQNLQDVGIAVTAFKGNQLREMGLFDTESLDDMTPGLIVTDTGTPENTIFTLRGVAQLDFADHHEGPIALYVDDVYVSSIAAVGTQMYDIDRVEVLKGPQGTLFGRNATGGLIHLLSTRPTDTFEGYLEASYAENNDIRIESAASIPLSENLNARVSLLKQSNDGWIDSGTSADLGESDNLSGRLQMLWEPNEDVALLLQGTGSSDDFTHTPSYKISSAIQEFPGFGQGDSLIRFADSAEEYDIFCQQVVGTGMPVPPNSTDCFGTVESNDSRERAGVDEVGYLDRDTYSFTANLDVALGDFDVKSITNWQKMTKSYLEDSDGTPNPLMLFGKEAETEQWSQELRVSRELDNFRWLTGLYFLHIETDAEAPTTFNFPGFSLDNKLNLETDSWALFFQGEYDISENLTFIGGLRWTEDEKDYVFDTSCDSSPLVEFGLDADCVILLDSLGFPGNSVQENGFSDDRSEGDYAFKVGLDWHPNDDWLVYGSVTRGNKAGSCN